MSKTLNITILSLAVIITGYLLASGYENRGASSEKISVTGLGKKDFTADLIVWHGSFLRKEQDLKEAYAKLDADREVIKAYLVEKGVPADDLVFSAVDIDKKTKYVYNEETDRSEQVFDGYLLQQKVNIASSEVNEIEKISREISELINLGVEFYSSPPSYYYTQLADLKIEMIAAATEDARIRAEQIAKNSNADLGDLENARMGVFQIIAQNSNEGYSWGGSFNTSSKYKTATITMKLDFKID